jgi:uridine kinase
LDKYYYCPHHPDSGFPGEVSDLKIICNCRKPKSGLIEIAINEFNISRINSWFIGDSTTDIKAGKASGLRTILLRTGYGGADNKCIINPDFIMNDLFDATQWIFQGYKNVISQLNPHLSNIVNSRIISIGGLARSGKSSIARVILDLLSSLKINAHILCLDGWLKSSNDRYDEMPVLDKYNISQFLTDLRSVLIGGGYINVPIYDRNSRQTNSYTRKFICDSDFIIIEGVPALVSNEIVRLSNYKIFISSSEDVRFDRFNNDYLFRGDKAEIIINKYEIRNTSEVPMILDSSNKADLIIKN